MNVNFHFKLNETEKQLWNDFWARCEHSHPRQHLVFGEIERATNRKPLYVTGTTNGHLAVVGIFSIWPLFFNNKYSGIFVVEE